jgi:hypothetical protein
MDVNGTEFASDMVAGAFAARNEAVALKAQANLLRKTLDMEQAAAVQLLQSMGVGQNLDAVG